MPTRKVPPTWLLHHSANSSMISSCTLPSNYPRTVGLRIATRWLHRLSFLPTSHKKDIYLYLYFVSYNNTYYVDGQERKDVVSYRKDYLKKLDNLQSNHRPPPSMQWWESCDPTCQCRVKKEASHDLPSPPVNVELRKKLVMIYHPHLSM